MLFLQIIVEDVRASVKGMEKELIELLSNMVACDSRLGQPVSLFIFFISSSFLLNSIFFKITGRN